MGEPLQAMIRPQQIVVGQLPQREVWNQPGLGLAPAMSACEPARGPTLQRPDHVAFPLNLRVKRTCVVIAARPPASTQVGYRGQGSPWCIASLGALRQILGTRGSWTTSTGRLQEPSCPGGWMDLS